ncbi:aspartyl/asparaginyl beta-hydroxylase domain-containing protein [Streptomyces sp. NPDC050287]|uniref:aspartyl/asparaginyl beta-hydroxylase domain-containing protein n=1 Tax=Streptomyces sp. NPDC050287 TaxID=3365608 RepID=UPI00378E798D
MSIVSAGERRRTSVPDDMAPILDANFHRGGLKCRRLFRVNPDFFSSVVEDAQRLVEQHLPSRVAEERHITNWTRPFGNAVQYSLLNRSGKFDDFSSDHFFTREGKRFHYAQGFPNLARFIEAFPYAYNMRLNGLGAKSGLSLHEEHVVFPTGDGRIQIRGRFHLPLVTSRRAEMALDGDIHHFEAGSVFFFNNGCIHSAMNHGQDFRYHLIWDVAFTKEAYDGMFGHVPVPGHSDLLEPVAEAEADVELVRRMAVGTYAPSGRGLQLYELLRLKNLGVKAHAWQNVYNRAAYRRAKRKPIAWWQDTRPASLLDYGHDAKD